MCGGCFESPAELVVALGAHAFAGAGFQPLEVAARYPRHIGCFLDGEAQALALFTERWPVHLVGGWGSFHAVNLRVSKSSCYSYLVVTCRNSQITCSDLPVIDCT